jgi:hypothetical protein
MALLTMILPLGSTRALTPVLAARSSDRLFSTDLKTAMARD